MHGRKPWCVGSGGERLGGALGRSTTVNADRSRRPVSEPLGLFNTVCQGEQSGVVR